METISRVNYFDRTTVSAHVVWDPYIARQRNFDMLARAVDYKVHGRNVMFVPVSIRSLLATVAEERIKTLNYNI